LDFTRRRIHLSSFSSIHTRQSAAQPQELETGFRVEQPIIKEDDEAFDPGLEPLEDPAGDEGFEDRLPGGTAMGSLVHDLLEKVDYRHIHGLTQGRLSRADALLKDAGIARLMAEQKEMQQLSDVDPLALARLITATVVRPLACVREGFCLGQLKADACCKEPDFLYTGKSPSVQSPDTAGRQGVGEETFLRGYVDLVFREEEKYYIVDFKTNYLAGGYREDQLAASMDHADYHLQYKIYTVALLRKLKLSLGEDFDPHLHFGGVLYLYLRGMVQGADRGVYFTPGDRLLPLGALEEELQQRIRPSIYG
jgi:exodeoxyribonuclease V beta subunit